MSISSRQCFPLPRLTLLQIVLKAIVAHPIPTILNHHHHTKGLKKTKRSEQMHGDGIRQGGKSGRSRMGDMGQCFEVVVGGRNCAAILQPTREERLEEG